MRQVQYLSEFVDPYLDEELEIARNLTRDSYTSYLTCLKMFLSFVSRELSMPVARVRMDKIDFELVHAFMIKTSVERKWAIRTWNSRLAAVKAFFDYLALRNPLYLNLSRRVSLIRCKRVPKDEKFYLTSDEIDAVLEAGFGNSWIDLRDKTILMFLFATGLRVAEMTSARIDNLTWKKKYTAHLRFVGKGQKSRVIPIVDKPLLQNLKCLIASKKDGAEYIFTTRDGFQMGTDNGRRIIDKAFKGHSGEKVTPHVIRRSAGMDWLSRDIDLWTISRMYGHDNVSTTEGYLGVRIEDKEEILRRSAGHNENYQQFKLRDGSDDEFIRNLEKRIRSRKGEDG